MIDLAIINTIATLITALGIIVAATKKGRAWINKPAIDEIEKNREDDKKFRAENMEHLKSIKRGGLRTELMILMNDPNSPEKDIYKAYESYEKLGGNFYIHDIFEKWRKNKDNKNKGEK